MAELWTVRIGLNFAHMENINKLEVQMDVLAAIQFITAPRIDNHPLGYIIYDCGFLMRQFERFNFQTHLPGGKQMCRCFTEPYSYFSRRFADSIGTIP
ncbi:hypothetical protein RHGRI_002253 [Rhododendron griersonianum]|uniref:RNase H type-1 domain-containing protein n=1 Tax=Rhododendron griersonianum TaxID=479676 RepID=A0AAV6LQV2_9ERIC|nr:hypothetical protein RHGRI_002253 [Rhododendron griersonianum]